MSKHKEEHQEDDVIFETELEQEGKSSFGSLGGDSQVHKLKKKLKKAEQQAKENLDGWQRLRADVANSKKEHSERIARAKSKGAEEVLESLLPALDSFDSAMQAGSWASIDDAWRQGMEFVHGQLIGALEQHGISIFGEVGDKLDPSLHEVGEGDGDKIKKILRKGYKSGDNVIRPARVVV